MSDSANAGRVLFVDRGEYNALTAYVYMDSLTYQGSRYVCKAPSTGNLPTNTTYFYLLAQKGEDGANAVYVQDHGIILT